MRRSAVVVVVALISACDPQPPANDVLAVSGNLQGPAGAVDVAFSDPRSRGEWWPCDLRMTNQACVNDDDGGRFHVGAFIGLPGHDELADLGGSDCVVDGAAQGAFEILRLKFDAGDPALIPDDVSAFVLLGSDVDGDGSADLADGSETRAAARIVSGTVEIGTLFGFLEPLSLRLTGTTAADTEEGAPVVVEFRGPMSNPALVPGLEPPATCVE